MDQTKELEILRGIIDFEIIRKSIYVIIYKNLQKGSRALKNKIFRARLSAESNRVTGWLTSILHRMGVVLMDKKPFDFKDLMQFGMFVISLLTFIYLICR